MIGSTAYAAHRLLNNYVSVFPICRIKTSVQSGFVSLPTCRFNTSVQSGFLFRSTCRFNTSVQFGLPDEVCRAQILQQYAKHLKPEEWAAIAEATPGLAGRDLKDLSDQAERRWASKVCCFAPLRFLLLGANSGSNVTTLDRLLFGPKATPLGKALFGPKPMSHTWQGPSPSKESKM